MIQFGGDAAVGIILSYSFPGSPKAFIEFTVINGVFAGYLVLWCFCLRISFGRVFPRMVKVPTANSKSSLQRPGDSLAPTGHSSWISGFSSKNRAIVEFLSQFIALNHTTFFLFCTGLS